jgi:hypothetical protein
MSYFHARPLSLAVQLLLLQRRFPEGKGEIHRSRLIWRLRIRPHVLAHEYNCRLEHSLENYPAMYCVDPPLSALAGSRRLPHVYTREEPICLCLFMKRRECWNDGMILADVVVPLAFYWLANFEDWLFSGEWRGGGTHAIAPEAPSHLPVFPGESSPVGLELQDGISTPLSPPAAA